MLKHKPNNLRIKRKYLVWLKDAKGLAEKSIDKAASSISTYEQYLDGKDFRAFHTERARGFKRRLSSQKNELNGANLSQSTINAILRDIKTFFTWLADQPGYKSKITHSDAAYFSADLKSERASRGGCWKPHPSPQQAKHVLEQMPIETVLQRRDRALIAFLFLTGSREGAAITIRLKHVDLNASCVHFDSKAVDTKFGKSFTSAFYPFGEAVEQILHDWVAELQNHHLFGSTDPLFPKTKVESGPNKRFATTGIKREPWASPSSAVKIFKAAFASAGLPTFSPHLVRDTLIDLANEYCRTPEDFKAWSQNISHTDVLTSFMSYGTVPTGRQMELLSRFRREGPVSNEG
ncbi:MAG: tyrosine-type recombinase/integrase [Hyphomicrobiales bacterium]|nr:tyrosine-type recombinase/integrase [Hyphomicrobiales bacterium]